MGLAQPKLETMASQTEKTNKGEETSEGEMKPIIIIDEDETEASSQRVHSPSLLRKARKTSDSSDEPVKPAVHLTVEGMKKRSISQKSSSTSTLFIKDTINAPDVDAVVKCMATVFYRNMKGTENTKDKTFRKIFSEHLHPLEKDSKLDLENTPNTKTIWHFLNVIFTVEQLSAECGVMAMAYLDRLTESTGITLHASNWRRIALSGIILASKVWEDQAVWNVDFLSCFPNVTVNDLNILERHLLNLLKFNVSLTSAEYAKFYFELRAISERGSKKFALAPLTKKKQERLEKKSRGMEDVHKSSTLLRAQSHDAWKGRKQGPSVIN